jgi:hypothetical protein
MNLPDLRDIVLDSAICILSDLCMGVGVRERAGFSANLGVEIRKNLYF